ncbi:hypothetical protein HFP57_11985 [Parasphingopyxis algicola]|uniref:ApeA N-terminal domain 1-containing protein n=1 Tax=Parasphingopyxis algicola TaxID=2026624 RepID=UPI0015A40963|nr:HEPN domain-containing protein [Parasphingopyxis algicola]QLC25664.1 hypothetical protein HFP57_11985 [Parasphingopyxis algicola]
MSAKSEIVDGAKLGGWFEFNDDRQLVGELSIDGSATTLWLQDREFFALDHDQHRDLRGTLHDLTKVTLIGCVIRSTMGSAGRYEERYTFGEIQPHYVASGHRHFDPQAAEIERVMFRIDDAEDIFYDFDAFGIVLDPEPLIETVVKGNETRINRKIPIGPNPEIVYFAGQKEIASVETAIGVVTVRHRPFTNPFFSPRRAAIENRILIELTFAEPQTFDNVIARIRTLLRFLEMIAGRPPNMEWTKIDLIGDEYRAPLDVYWCMQPRRQLEGETRKPHSSEILINAVRSRDHFERVLKSWIAMDSSRAEARMRFSGNFGQQHMISIDRLVGAANMFDILPDDALPPNPPLEEELANARQSARSLFLQLPQSEDRDGILGALGRLGRRTLRQKIFHRATIVSNGLGSPLTDLPLVVDEAVKCRNHFVHGSAGSFDYHEYGHLIAFLTHALEFIFAASDLLEAGWDAQAWQSNSGVLIHPFSEVLHGWNTAAAEIAVLRS